MTGFIGGEVKGSVGDYTEDGMRRRGFVQAGIPIVSTLVDGLSVNEPVRKRGVLWIKVHKGGEQ